MKLNFNGIYNVVTWSFLRWMENPATMATMDDWGYPHYPHDETEEAPPEVGWILRVWRWEIKRGVMDSYTWNFTHWFSVRISWGAFWWSIVLPVQVSCATFCLGLKAQFLRLRTFTSQLIEEGLSNPHINRRCWGLFILISLVGALVFLSGQNVSGFGATVDDLLAMAVSAVPTTIWCFAGNGGAIITMFIIIPTPIPCV